MLDGNSLPGCHVRLLPNGPAVPCKSDGRFDLPVPAHRESTIEVSYQGMTNNVQVSGIHPDNTPIQLDTIRLFFNKMISVKEYNALAFVEQQSFQEILHWTNLLGYIHTCQIDTSSAEYRSWSKTHIHSIDYTTNTILIRRKDNQD
jgi:hypothetical protein